MQRRCGWSPAYDPVAACEFEEQGTIKTTFGTEVGIFVGTSVGAQPDIIKLVTMTKPINNLCIFKISPSCCFNLKQTKFYWVMLFLDDLTAWIVPRKSGG